MLLTIYDVLLFLLLWSTGLSLGMSTEGDQVVAALGRRRLLATALLVNVLVVPLITWGLLAILPVDRDYAIGVLLVGMAAAGPVGLKAAQMAAVDVPLALALVVILELLNLFFVPLWAALLMPSGVHVDVLALIVMLAVYVAAPLAGGYLVQRLNRRRARQWAPWLSHVGTGALVLVVLMVVLNSLHSLALVWNTVDGLVSFVLPVVYLVIGFGLGGSQPGARRAVGLITTIRAGSPALLIARQSFPNQPDVTLGVIVTALSVLVVGLITAGVWRWRSGRTAGS